jgi:hypothetical protein
MHAELRCHCGEVRPSDDTRERTVARLQRGYATGTLRTDTFSARLHSALHARTRAELHGLTADLPAATLLERALQRAGGLLPRRRPRPLLDPERLASGRIVIGRSSACELVVADDTVSRRHAALELRQGGWRIVDLGSTNGTWVNGRRVVEAEVLAGDELQLGAARFRI